MKLWLRIMTVALAIALVGCSTPAEPSATPPPVASPTAAPTRPSPTEAVAEADPTATTVHPSPTTVAVQAEPTAAPEATSTQPTPAGDPFDLLSQESLFETLEDLTAIRPYAGWRNSGSRGEAEALDYVAGRLGAMQYLAGLGLGLERQEFPVFLATELHETSLWLTVGGIEIEVPADGQRGPRDDVEQARRFDSDGALDDSAANPVEAAGRPAVFRSAGEIRAAGNLQGQVAIVDYAILDRTVLDTPEAVTLASELLGKRPAGVVLITSFSNVPGESHAAFVGDGSAFTWVEVEPVPPILYARLEDLAPAGIDGWQGLQAAESARLRWDADVLAPGTSGNLVATIPGRDRTRTVILGAHIDSPNAPGAMDDGSGSAILLEVARVLDAAAVQPPADLVLAWFGSEELGLYGATHFVATHQELLDRTVAMLQVDCLSRPLDGVQAELKLVTWPYGRLGDERMLWPDLLVEAAGRRGVEARAEAAYFVYSDNSTFGGFDVPHADLIYEPVAGPNDSVHYLGHMHDPYDTVELAREVGAPFEDMARVALIAALEADLELDALRVTPQQAHRALFVASHTEAAHMSPSSLTDLGMTLAAEGFDVDLVPFGEPVTAADLEASDLVVVLPAVDLAPADSGGGTAVVWSGEEVAALEAYAAGGGLLVVTNSAHRLKYGGSGLDENEDWAAANELVAAFGLAFEEGQVRAREAQLAAGHPLLAGVDSLEMGVDNAVPLSPGAGNDALVLAEADGAAVAVLLPHGAGQVLVLADLGLLTTTRGEPQNVPFWQNLARMAAGGTSL